MADFDALIKQALKTQNSADPAVRDRVYQSSRNALLRMLEKSGSHEAPAGKLHLAELEASIARIEQEYAPSPTPPQDIIEQVQPSVDANLVEPTQQDAAANVDLSQIDTPQVDAPLTSNVQYSPDINTNTNVNADVSAPAQNNYAPHNYTSQSDQGFQQIPESSQQAEILPPEVPPNDPQPPLNYKRKSPILRRLSGLLVILIVLGVIAWLAYAFVTNLSKPTDGAAQQKLQEQQKIDQSSLYLDVLTPSDPSALVTSGRGTAEVVTELNTQYLRIQSIRTSPNSTTNAEPILLELQPGVLQKITGKSVTVEIRTKSGNSENGLFSVQCLVSGKSVCDRKRFPVGQQPENVIFALNLSQDAVHGDTFLAINTDVKSTVNTSGAGSPIDILYVRVRIPK